MPRELYYDEHCELEDDTRYLKYKFRTLDQLIYDSTNEFDLKNLILLSEEYERLFGELKIKLIAKHKQLEEEDELDEDEYDDEKEYEY